MLTIDLGKVGDPGFGLRQPGDETPQGEIEFGDGARPVDQPVYGQPAVDDRLHLGRGQRAVSVIRHHLARLLRELAPMKQDDLELMEVGNPVLAMRAPVPLNRPIELGQVRSFSKLAYWL